MHDLVKGAAMVAIIGLGVYVGVMLLDYKGISLGAPLPVSQ